MSKGLYHKNKKKRLKTHYRALFFLTLVVLGLFLFNLAYADEIGNYYYRIDFEDYNLGNIAGQFNWSGEEEGDIIEIIEVVPNKILKLACDFGICEYRKNFLGNVLAYKNLEFRIVYLSEIPFPADFWLELHNTLAGDSPSIFGKIFIERNEGNLINVYLESDYVGNKILIYENLNSIENLEIEWKTILTQNVYRIKVIGQDWSGYYKTTENRKAELEFLDFGIGSTGFIEIDDIYLSNPSCDSYHCEFCGTSQDCENAGCVWNWNTGICETEILEVCGAGENLVFCRTEEECENYGGFWVNGFCFENEPEEPSEFSLYYNTHTSNKYPEPTDFVNSLANFFNPVFKTMSGFLLSFENKFNIASASKYGEMLGSAIAETKNYTSIINNFFGGLPIGEALFIYLIFSILLIILKIIFRLVNFIKP